MTDGIPDGIARWLGRTLLLYGIPFHYIVPDPRMLPPESIRFFYVDPGWLKCLLEGACSVGRTSSRDQDLDREIRDRFLRRAPLEAAGVRNAETRAQVKANGGKLNWPLTGFLLRSRAVAGWQGLEMTASGVDGSGNVLDPLQPLRIDRLGPDVMLCVFNGKVTRLVVKEPPEGLHFGAAPDARGGFSKGILRKVSEPVGKPGTEPVGKPVTLDPPMGLPMREGRVVKVAELAGRMKDALGAGTFTSAELGLQMVESPAEVVFEPRGGQL